MTKYNKQIFDLLVKARSKGHSIEQCAYLAGIHRITLHRWLNLGLEGEQPYQAFFRRFQKGKAAAAGELLDTLHAQALAGCKSSAFFLLDRVHGFSANPAPPVQVNIDAGTIDVTEVLREYKNGIQPILEGPIIDLDEE